MKETKHRSTRWALGVWALVLAAALLLAGCGGASDAAAPAGPSAAADQSSDNSRSTPGAAALAAQTDRITDQYTLEKNVSGVWGEEAVQYISVHVPQLECDSPDAVSLNKELAAIYAADFREYEAYEEAGQPGGEYPQIGVGWDAYWYGDCVSLVVRSRYDGTAPWRYSGWCFDFATGQQITVAEMLQRMGLDPDTVQQQVRRQAMQAFDRDMAQGAYYESLRLGGELSQMRMDTLEYNELENLCLLLPEQNQLVLRGRYSAASEAGWQQLDMELSLPPADTPVLTDTFDGVQVQLKGTQATITVSPAPKTATWDTELNLRLEQARTYPILGSYNEYVDVCIGQQTDSVFHPVVYLLTKDGVVEYVDVLRCLLFGNAMICQDPIYIANNGVSLERSGNSKVNLRRKDGSVLELADLSSEWSVQDIPSSITGSFNCANGNWLELSSDGSVQLGVQNNSRIEQGDAAYLGVVPEGMVLAIFTDTGLDFVAAFKMDHLSNDLTMTMIDGQNPFAEGETQLQMTYSYG
ncbi:acid-shock protein [Faecalibacterium prausnitzii]|uniref:Acid-shock protein n=1 Tax=Faecalibacterium prausnitzii TaxID=853 RepID=A0A2A7B3P9_9FIRM|nr:acid-shock protein [Faecalibacterium prausnitzii]PDX85980.1 acid-shock protein [Faecalibacterium prausnitzii]